MAHFDWNCFSFCVVFLIFISQGFGEGQNISSPLWHNRGQCIAACVKINDTNKAECVRRYSSIDLQEPCETDGCSGTATCEECYPGYLPGNLSFYVNDSSLLISWANTKTGIAIYQTSDSSPVVILQQSISLPFNTENNETLPPWSLKHFTECGLNWAVSDVCQLMDHMFRQNSVDIVKITYSNNRLHIRLDKEWNVLIESFTATDVMWKNQFTSTPSLIVDEEFDYSGPPPYFQVNIRSKHCDYDIPVLIPLKFTTDDKTELEHHVDHLQNNGYVQMNPSELGYNQLSEDTVEITLDHSICPNCSHSATCIYLYWGLLSSDAPATVSFVNPRLQKLERDESSVELTGLGNKPYGYQAYYVKDEKKFNDTVIDGEKYQGHPYSSFELIVTDPQPPYIPATPGTVAGESHAPKGNSLLFMLLGIGGGICILAYACCLLCFLYHRNSSIKNKVQRNEQSVQNVYDDHPSRNNSRKSSATSDHLTLSDFHKSVMLADHWEFEPMRLKLGASLGKGAFGQVVEGFLEGRVCVRQSTKSGWEWIPQDTGKKDVLKVAVKLLKDFATDSQKQEFLQEIQMMKNLGYHPNVVCLIGCCTVMEPVCLVVEACPQGDLKKYLLNCRSKILARIKEECLEVDDLLTSADLLSFARQITMGMEYLSQKGYVHRDLAARNVLVSDNKSLKIADFGLTRYIYEERQYVGKKGARIPVKWMSVEAIIDGVYTSESDVWSFGVVLYEIITLGGEPYPGIVNRDLPKMLCSGFRMEQPEQCPDDLYTMMLDTWHESPKQRPTFTKLRLQLEAMLEQSTPYLSLYPSQAHIFHCLDDIREESDEIDSANEAEPMLIEGDHPVDRRQDQSPSKLICNQNFQLHHLSVSKEESEDDKDEKDSVLEAEMEEDRPNQSLNDSVEYVNTGRQMSQEPSTRDEIILSLLSSPDSCDSGVAVDNRFLYDSKGRPIEYEGMEHIV